MIDHAAVLWRYSEVRSRIDRVSHGTRHGVTLLSAITGLLTRQR